ncbi:MAG: type I DNA topoisomerase [Armatimonadota bacterium]
MADKLIIVESPAKTRTIKNYLGDDYEIMASMGHVRDLPENGLGVDVEHGFTPEYVTIKEKGDVLSKLRKAAQKAKTIYLATDPDREGEAIAWHLREALHLNGVQRIEFNEITRSAITSALEHPRTINEARVNAQQARRVLDRLVGYQLSPLLWRKVRRGLSAGRVQSVAVKLICDREREIQAFVTEEFWSIIAQLTPQGMDAKLSAKLIERDHQKLKLSNEEEARAAEAELRTASYRVGSVKVSKQQRRPQPPFITSTLQQEANRSFGLPAKRTMAIAQQLYEGLEMGGEGHVGLITYMRTDSTRISKEAEEATAKYILERYGKEYLPATERKAKAAAKGAQEAHEAIRPTDPYRTPESIADRLSADQLKLYRLIWRRFLASQMANATLEVMVVDIEAKPYTLRANGQRVIFTGYLALSPDREESEFLPPVKEGQPLDLLELTTEQHFTQPPARYTEATLVKAMEARGIGRPSTYAPTIGVIQDRRYVFLETKKFHPTGLGMVVTEQLEKHFPNIVDPDFTARMESDLDEIESGTEDWVRVLAEFYGPFETALTEAAEKMERIKVPDVELEQVCPKCGKQLALREGRFGRFVACTGFPECDFTGQEDQVLGKNGEEGAEGEGAEEQPQVECNQCGAPMVVRKSRRGPFLGCSKYPECTNTQPMPGEEGKEQPKKEPAQLTAINCEKCGRPMAIRNSKRGQFLGCSGFPRCRNLKKMPEEEVVLLTPEQVEALKAAAAEKKAAEAAKKSTAGTKKSTTAGTKKTAAPKKAATSKKKTA